MPKTKAEDPPCSCVEHRALVPTTVGKHTYKLVTTHDDPDTYAKHDGELKWRWECSCGHKGQWNQQSKSTAYHAWENHLRKVGIYR